MMNWATSNREVDDSASCGLEGETSQIREIRPLASAWRWDPEQFAREQVRGLVRQIFFSRSNGRVRQVVFSAIGPETDLRFICRAVGEELAQENSGSVAVVGGYPQLLANPAASAGEREAGGGSTDLRSIATRLRPNLWLIPESPHEQPFATKSVQTQLCDLRREFDYSIVGAPPAAQSHISAAMGQVADGVILVLSAHHTRRATAIKVKEALDVSQVRILGTVLSDRMFPIPEKVYRRL